MADRSAPPLKEHKDVPPDLAQQARSLAVEVGLAAQTAAVARFETLFKEICPWTEDAISRESSISVKATGPLTTCDASEEVSASPNLTPAPMLCSSMHAMPATTTAEACLPVLLPSCVLKSGDGSERGQDVTYLRSMSPESLAQAIKESAVTPRSPSPSNMDSESNGKFTTKMASHVSGHSTSRRSSVTDGRARLDRMRSNRSMIWSDHDSSLGPLNTGQVESMLHSQCILELSSRSRTVRTSETLHSALRAVLPRTVLSYISSSTDSTPTDSDSFRPPTDSESSRPFGGGRNSRNPVDLTDDLRHTNDLSLAQAVMPAVGLRSVSLHRSLFPLAVFWFRFWGLFPCNNEVFQRFGLSHVNRYLVMCIAVVVAAYRIDEVSQAGLSSVHHLSDMVFSLGGLACLLASRALHNCQAFTSDAVLVVNYAKRFNFHARWRWDSRKHLVVSVLVWILVVVVRVLLDGVMSWPGILRRFHADGSSDPPGLLDISAFAFNVGIFTAVLYFVLHFVDAFSLAVDCFASRFITNPDCVQGVHDWDTLRAILRLGSTGIWRLLMVPATTTSMMLFLCSANALLDEKEPGAREALLPALAPVTILTCMTSYVLFAAANVTTACERLPPIINSFHTCTDEDHKERLVRYIQNSATGFYIGDMLLTTSTVFKVVNLGVLVTFTVFTKAMTRN